MSIPFLTYHLLGQIFFISHHHLRRLLGVFSGLPPNSVRVAPAMGAVMDASGQAERSLAQADFHNEVATNSSSTLHVGDIFVFCFIFADVDLNSLQTATMLMLSTISTTSRLSLRTPHSE
jgi:hypothetical protein